MRAPCPPEDAFVQLLEGELDEEEREAITRHADTCADCAALLVDLALLLQPEGEGGTPALPAAATLGRYTILRQLGAGGMGVVYEAEDPTLKRRVALKVLRADVDGEARRKQLQSRLLREAQALAALEHPNVLAVYDAFTWQEQVVLAVQFVDGAPVSDWLQAEPRGWRERLGLFLQAGKGLAAAHAAGIVHRDIKPDNILVSRNGGVFVADFGLARTVSDNLQHVEELERDAALPDTRNLHASLLTQTGAVLGTPAYMSPEQHLALATDARTDQFSFAASLFRALYDLKPFEGDSLHALKDAVTLGKLQPRPLPSEIPPALYDLLAVALAVKPNDRFPDMNALLAALEEAARPPAPAPRRSRRRTFAGVALGALALTALAGGVASFLLKEPPALSTPVPTQEVPQSSPPPLIPPLTPTLDQAVLCGRGDLNACDRFSRDALFAYFDDSLVFSLEDATGFDRATRPLVEPLERACERAAAPDSCLIRGIAASVHVQGGLYPEDAATLQTFSRFALRACELGSLYGCELAIDLTNPRLYKDLLPPSVEDASQAAQRGCDAGHPGACLALAREAATYHLERASTERALPLLERACDLGASEGCFFAASILQPPSRSCLKRFEALHKLIGEPENSYVATLLAPESIREFCDGTRTFDDPARALELARKGCDHAQDAPSAPFRVGSCALALDLQPQQLKACRAGQPEPCQQVAHLLTSALLSPSGHWDIKRSPWFLSTFKGMERGASAACDAGGAEACLALAEWGSRQPGGVLLAEGPAVPAYVAHIEQSCDLGDLTACARYVDVWLDGDFDREGEWSLKPSPDTLRQHLLPRCERDPRVCWLIGDLLFSPNHTGVPANPQQASDLIDQACERADHPLACLFGALLHLDAPSKEREAFLQRIALPIPINNLLPGAPDLDALRAFGRSTARLADADRSHALAARGCAADTPRYLQSVKDASCALAAWSPPIDGAAQP